MASSFWLCIALALSSFANAIKAQPPPENAQWLDVEFSRDSPVLPVSFGLRPSAARITGNSTTLDLHASILLRNTSQKVITGLTLRIEAQDLAPAGKASITVPSLNVHPGDTFPVRVDLELRKPYGAISMQGAVVQVRLDCLLFRDFTGYGPDKLNSRRALIVYELQARRERQHVLSLLAAGRLAEIREELNFGMQDPRPPVLGLELSRVALRADRDHPTTPLEMMRLAGSPVTPTGGFVKIAGGNVSAPQIDLKNDSQKTIRSIEVGWIVRDEQGKEYFAGSMPAIMELKPVESGTLSEPATLHFFQSAGQPVSIGSLVAFVSDVEFSDGDHWIPSREAIAASTKNPVLRRALADSPEQQRLADIYRRKGINGLVSDLKRPD